MDTDPEFYERFSKRIENILEELRQKKIADIEALKQLRLIRDDVINKKDENLPNDLEGIRGADIFYRNLHNEMNINMSSSQYINIVIGLTNIIRKEAIVDWYKNLDVKRKIMNKIDDYLYDEVKGKMGVNLKSEEVKKLINLSLQLAENNYEIFSV